MVAEQFRRLAVAALLLWNLSACASEPTKEQAYFAATERCQSYFAGEIESTLEQTGNPAGLEQFLRAVSANGRGEFAKLLRHSANRFESEIGSEGVALPLSSAHILSAYAAVTNDIALISECQKLETYVSTYLLADQLRVAAHRKNVSLPVSALGVDSDNQDEVSKALLATLVVLSVGKGPE